MMQSKGNKVSVHCKNWLTYEEILDWRGFAFETSRKRGLFADDIAKDGEYGIAESDRIMLAVQSKGRHSGCDYCEEL